MKRETEKYLIIIVIGVPLLYAFEMIYKVCFGQWLVWYLSALLWMLGGWVIEKLVSILLNIENE